MKPLFVLRPSGLQAFWPSIFILLTLTLSSCGVSYEYEDWWMDSPKTRDVSLSDPTYLVSTNSNLTAADKAKPVIIAAHGYSATTYEWEEFRDHVTADGRVLVSLVLLGGHGRDVHAFEESTWRQWGAPILAEYRALVEQGYTNISLVGSSTGGALILQQLHEKKYDVAVKPRHIFFVDAIVVPGDKLLSLVDVVGPIIGNLPSENTTEEKRHWYTNRPASTFQELNSLLSLLKDELEEGITLPAGTRAKIYKSSQDPTADPVSALLMHKGLRTASGGKVEVQLFDTELHVFTRLKAREKGTYYSSDIARQQAVFNELIERVLE
jgi:carboxylesterase